MSAKTNTVQMPTPTIGAEVMTVTPEMAQAFLDGQIKTNRPMRDKHIRNLERAIREGRWMLNGESLKFNRDGAMLDGQHRCCAIIRAGKPVQMLVVRDVAQEAFTSLDGGAKRSASDYLGNETHRMLLSAAGRWMRIYESGKSLQDSFQHNVFTSEIIETLDRHPGLSDSAKRCYNIRLGQGSLCVFLHYIYGNIIKGDWAREDVDRFFIGLADGKDLSSKSSCFLLREMLMRAKVEKKTINRVRVVALTIKALKFHLAKQPIGTLKFIDSEEFPKVS